MLNRNRVRRLEHRLAVARDGRSSERVHAMINAANSDTAANEALEEIADAHFNWGHDDPRTLAVIERHGPVIAAAIERHGGVQAT